MKFWITLRIRNFNTAPDLITKSRSTKSFSKKKKKQQNSTNPETNTFPNPQNQISKTKFKNTGIQKRKTHREGIDLLFIERIRIVATHCRWPRDPQAKIDEIWIEKLRDAFALIEKMKKNNNKRAVKMKGKFSKFLAVRRVERETTFLKRTEFFCTFMRRGCLFPKKIGVRKMIGACELWMIRKGYFFIRYYACALLSTNLIKDKTSLY